MGQCPPGRSKINAEVFVSVQKLVCIGGSSGAPMLAATLLERFPADLDAAVLLALHIPVPLVSSFAATLKTRSPMAVEMAVDGKDPMPGRVYVCPGGMHIGLGKNERIVVTPRPEGTPFKPSIDILFHTAAQIKGPGVIAVVLKGLTLKRDARQGSLSVKHAGGHVIVQNDPIDTLFGMTKDVIDAGGATDKAPLSAIPDLVVKLAGRTGG